MGHGLGVGTSSQGGHLHFGCWELNPTKYGALTTFCSSLSSHLSGMADTELAAFLCVKASCSFGLRSLNPCDTYFYC